MSDIICPQCKTEVKFESFQNQENPQCDICGKILIAEALKFKTKYKGLSAKNLNLTPKSDIENSRKLGQKLQKLGDDELFGELEPFDLTDGEIQDEEEDELVPPTINGPTNSRPNRQKVKNEDFDEEAPVFKNPMETSNLIKKLKDDHDLFESLDNK